MRGFTPRAGRPGRRGSPDTATRWTPRAGRARNRPWPRPAGTPVRSAISGSASFLRTTSGSHDPATPRRCLVGHALGGLIAQRLAGRRHRPGSRGDRTAAAGRPGRARSAEPPPPARPAGAVPHHVAAGVGIDAGLFVDQLVVQGADELVDTLPRLPVAGEHADGEQLGGQPGHVLGLRPAAVAQCLDRGYDLPLGGAHIAVPVQRRVGVGRGRGDRPPAPDVRSERTRRCGLAQARGVPGDEGRVRQPPRAVAVRHAQLGGAGQPGHRRQGAAAPGRRFGRGLQDVGDLLVRIDGRGGQVRRPALEVLAVEAREPSWAARRWFGVAGCTTLERTSGWRKVKSPVAGSMSSRPQARRPPAAAGRRVGAPRRTAGRTPPRRRSRGRSGGPRPRRGRRRSPAAELLPTPVSPRRTSAWPVSALMKAERWSCCAGAADDLHVRASG